MGHTNVENNETYESLFQPIKQLLNNLQKETKNNLNTQIEQSEKKLPDTISEPVFKDLLHWEGSNGWVGRKYWENFYTWAYGMTRRHLDSHWKPLNDSIPYPKGKKISDIEAKENARAYYNKRAKERATLLKKAWYKYTQNQLDALVAASSGTENAVQRLKDFVISHWNEWPDVISNFILGFATKSQNWQEQPGLIIARARQAGLFNNQDKNKYTSLREYQKEYFQRRKKKTVNSSLRFSKII